MRRAVLFTALAACSGGAAPSPQTPWPRPPPVDAAPDAALPVAVARGGSCGPAHACAAGLSCFAAPGGYCASTCGALGGGAPGGGTVGSGAACDDGVCATTARDGELCLARCERDADCRTDEGYFCDPQWRACAIPNTLAMVPRTCPGTTARDLAFSAPEQLATDAPGAFHQAPAAVIASDGSMFIVAAAPGAEVTQLIDTRVPAASRRDALRRSPPPATAQRETGARPGFPPATAQRETGARPGFPPATAQRETGIETGARPGFPPATAQRETGIETGARPGFSPPTSSRVFVETAPERGASASLARDRKGVLYAVWLDARRGPSVMLARSRDDGRTWTAPIVASEPADCALDDAPHTNDARTDDARTDDPRTDDPRTNDRRTDDPRTSDSRFNDSRSAALLASPFGERACLEQAFVAVGPDPGAKQRDVVYVGYAAAGALRVRASFDEGATFRAPATALPAVRASATVDATGTLHVIGVQGVPGAARYGSANHAIVYTTSTDAGRTFARPSTLSRRDERLPYDGAVPRIVVDDKRRWRYALYARGGRDGVWDLALLASKDRGTTWKRTRIGDDCTIHLTPQLALDARTGALHLAWYDTIGGAGRFAHARCTPGLATCTAPLAINARPFAALGTAPRSPISVGDAALLVDAARRTLHAVWAQPVDEPGGPRTRIFHAAAKLPNR